MIDLRVKGLPSHIDVAGRSFLIKTDFRLWLDFDKKLSSKDCRLVDLLYLLDESYYTDTCLECLFANPREFCSELMQFYTNANLTPKKGDTGADRVIDYIEDGEYIYASFLQAYNIDLVDVEELHWHKFKALLLGLPDNTKIKEIMSMRGWRKSNKTYEEQAKENKKAWELPKDNNYDADLLEEINNEFYNC